MSALSVGIIGAGVAGSAAAYALATRGATVHVFDQYAEGHDRGASHGESRLIRLAYFERPNYVPLLRRAYDEWRALENDCGETLFQHTGLLEVGPESSGLIAGVERAAIDHGLTLTALSRDDIEKRCAGLLFPAGWRVIVEENAGCLLADQALAAFRRGAAAGGAQFHWNEKVIGLDIADAGLTLSTDERRYEIDRVIIAPGPWADNAFAALGLPRPCPITPVVKSNCWFALRDGANFTIPFALEDEGSDFFYAIPKPQGGAIKIGAHHDGRILNDPDDDRRPDETETNDIAAFVADYLPGVNPSVQKQIECLYEKSPDGDFVIDLTAEDHRIAYAIGLSGHGFKFAPVIGEILADMAQDAPTPKDAAFLSSSRFE